LYIYKIETKLRVTPSERDRQTDRQEGKQTYPHCMFCSISMLQEHNIVALVLNQTKPNRSCTLSSVHQSVHRDS